MNRLAALDWARGMAVVIMIVCHAFNALVRPQEQGGGAYILSQVVGGMASVLFLFLAGVTFAIGMAGGDRRGWTPARRFVTALQRGAWVLGFAYLFRVVNWSFDASGGSWQAILKVDILNCMGMAMLVMAPLALLPSHRRIAAAVLAGVAFAVIAPLLSQLDWSAVPRHVHDYLKPRRGGFPLFPYGAYLAFGMAAGGILPRYAGVRWEQGWGKAMLAAAAGGMMLVVFGRDASSWHKPLIDASDFWIDGSSLVAIRVGMVLLLIAAAWLWTEHTAEARYSWVQTLGRESLLVYWAHIAIVYGRPLMAWRNKLTIGEAVAVTVVVLAAMTALAQARIWWKQRRAARRSAAAATSAEVASVQSSRVEPSGAIK